MAQTHRDFACICYTHTPHALLAYVARVRYELLTGQPPWQRDEDEDLDSGLAKMKVLMHSVCPPGCR